MPDTTLLDSITDADASTAGTVVFSGSHGGLYPAAVASQAQARAVIFNDAGIGYQSAGIAGAHALSEIGLAAATVACMSSEIGSARETRDNGRISFVNAAAEALGVEVGQTAIEAAALLCNAQMPERQMPKPVETWATVPMGADGAEVHLLDSAALVGPRDAGQIVITGSHGGLVGGDPKRARRPAALRLAGDAGLTSQRRDRATLGKIAHTPYIDAPGRPISGCLSRRRMSWRAAGWSTRARPRSFTKDRNPGR